MDLHIRKILGTNAKWDSFLGRWVEGQCWLVCLADWPYRIVRVPKFAVLSDCEAGDEDVILDVMSWLAREIEQEAWKRQMEAGR